VPAGSKLSVCFTKGRIRTLYPKEDATTVVLDASVETRFPN